MLTRRRQKRTSLAWSKTPSRSTHPSLGLRFRWWERERGYTIERFPHQTGRFIACRIVAGTPTPLGDFASLQAAKRACEETENSFRSKPR